MSPTRNSCTRPDATAADARGDTVPAAVLTRRSGSIARCMSKCRGGGSPLVPVAREQHEQRVAAELDRLAADVRRDRDEWRHDPVQRLDEVLDAGLSALGETLAQRRETSDVEGQEAAVQLQDT